MLDDEKMIYIMDVDASRALFMMSIALQVHVGISCIGVFICWSPESNM